MTRDEHSWNHGLVRGPDDKQPRLDPFAAARDVAAMQFGPQLVFGDAGSQRRFHLAHRGLAGDDRAAHAEDLVGRFDEAGVLHHRLAIADGNAEARECGDAFGIEMIGGDAAVSAAMFLDEIGNAGRPALDALAGQLAAIEIDPRHRRPDLVDHAGMVGQMLAGEIVEQHDRPFGRDEAMAGVVVRDPQLHVGRIGGVADVDGVVEQGAGIVAALQLGADALEAVAAHGRQVRIGDAGGRPFGLGHGAIAEHMLVERRRLFTRGAAEVGLGARLERHDLAVAAEGGFGRCPSAASDRR